MIWGRVRLTGAPRERENSRAPGRMRSRRGRRAAYLKEKLVWAWLCDTGVTEIVEDVNGVLCTAWVDELSRILSQLEGVVERACSTLTVVRS